MKILKFNETTEPEIGDYVICDEPNPLLAPLLGQDVLNIFLLDNIGKIIDRTKKGYLVHYDNIPTNISRAFANGSRIFSKDFIKYFSKDFEHLEVILAANKYNL